MTFTEIADELGEFSKQRTKIQTRILLAALSDLCQGTWAFTEILPILTTAGTVKHTLTPATSNTKICGIFAAQRGTVNVPQPSISTALTGGTLSAATYSYKVTAITDDHGETLPCAAVTQITSGSTSTVTLTWTAIAGASGYRIYGRGDADWKLLKETTALTWTDDNSESQGTAVPPTESRLMEEIDVVNPGIERTSSNSWRPQETDNILGVIYNGDTAIELDRVPVTSGMSFQLEIALYPTAVITVPGTMEAHKETLINYVKWKMYEMPKSTAHPWGDNGRKAMTFRKQYVMAKSNLKGRKMVGFGGESRIQPVFFC